MSLTVKKPFTTALQRFSVGDEIPDDTNLFPHTAESLAEGGFAGKPPSSKSAKTKADDKPTED
ncbi:hypothetical protein EN742_02990 [Mesorhizobium sp. M4A.F.Ca.ET.020.02.1.1]|uniref:hypothetical protein n=1 Tax=Mesorhizobium sp. M4A.F.Ca.ET.020.02.1.1 TaxID=2496652 RepID=UPI000FD4546A|nr:hypothetical protein [Mesorhizobium sp. M4A.F.Ca.ET.020.02.1.1]RVD44211.1 hypothetical protein EN742_02990 [Mesorhizobium sp. M4A.F.Ca.ET.020.02.1.1]